MPPNNNTFLKVITHSYPDLQIYKIRLHDPNEGQYNHVLSAETNAGPIIFRFPRSEIGVATIQNELRILGRLQDKTALPIPNPIYTSRDTQTPGQVFMGYPMLPGRPLLREHLKTAANPAILRKWATHRHCRPLNFRGYFLRLRPGNLPGHRTSPGPRPLLQRDLPALRSPIRSQNRQPGNFPGSHRTLHIEECSW